MAIQYYVASADVLGTVQETFNISSSNNKLSIAIDGGSAQLFTLTSGSSRTAAQVATDLNTTVAAHVTLLSGNAGVTYTAVTTGTPGNSITVRYFDPGVNNATLSVSVTSLAITVSLATDSGGAITSTALLVKAAVDAFGASAALVTTLLTGTGGTVVTAVGTTNLAGGISGLTGASASAYNGFFRLTTNSGNGSGSTILFNSPSNNANSTLGVSGTTTGFARISTAFVGNVKADISTNLETILLSAGWTTISGHATTNLLMQSGLSPSGLQMRLRIKDNGGNCSALSIENKTSTIAQGNTSTNQGLFLLPGTLKNFRVIANKYQAFIFSTSFTSSREFVYVGVPALPSELVGLITDCIIGAGDAQTDSDAIYRATFRTALDFDGNNTVNLMPNQAFILNGSFAEVSNNTWFLNGVTAAGNNNGTATLRLISTSGRGSNNQSGYRWHDGASFINDAIISFGMSSNNDEGLARGYIWDACVVSDFFAADNTVTGMDSHNWWIVTQNNMGGSNGDNRGSLFLVVP
jgi:hypothetical protein